MSFYLVFIENACIFDAEVNKIRLLRQESLLNGKYFILILTYVAVRFFVKRTASFIFASMKVGRRH